MSASWKEILGAEREKDYFKSVIGFVENERSQGKIIYPKNSDVFNAFTFTPLEKLKVVILGQDPYHGPQQAHGLCFSVQKGVPPPPSLVNIFKELESDVGITRPSHGCLQSWAEQGVLLLNAVLTVEESKPGSHANKGWETFTDTVVKKISADCTGVAFLLWGSYAQKKGESIDRKKHSVLTAPHPSPLSAHRGFLGCKHFSQANELLRSREETQIDWNLP